MKNKLIGLSFFSLLILAGVGVYNVSARNVKLPACLPAALAFSTNASFVRYNERSLHALSANKLSFIYKSQHAKNKHAAENKGR
ncbi:hypothetical protein PCNPT3_12120 [Psychromonas sp. CNPT3]|uniref:hypothetical protein n=1 Tax=Psychromonas sp. CNPT3 TaxID=314282 RepID=UPI00006E9E59|nr:hypothetical protein [Psychromonas sp. CNPT3]AGH82360.1 hypothetical protein PCNPT3_12120 [Psychromonas sp. CNPT3]